MLRLWYSNSMSYRSKYYNLDRPGEYHDRVVFGWVVERLETMSREELVALLDRPEIGIAFGGANWRQLTPHEELVSVLISDVEPQVLLQVLGYSRAA